MIIGDPISTVGGASRSRRANDLSRRALLRAGAAAGGGLMLGFSLPFTRGAAAADAFTPNAFAVLALFIALGALAVIRFHPEAKAA